jgi:branched-chain amino acid transport system substrate-binding protein
MKAFLPLLLFLLTGCWNKSGPEPIFIGQVVVRDGDQAQSQAARGVVLAVADANAAEGQVNGRSVAVVRPDWPGPQPTGTTQPATATVQAVAVKLVTLNRVAGIVGCTDEPTTETLLRMAQQYSLPVLTTASAPGLAPYGFSVSPGTAMVGKTLGKFVREDLKKSPVLLIVDKRSRRAGELGAAFAREYENHQSELKQRTIANPEELEALAREATQEIPGAIVFLGPAGEFRKLVGALGEAKLAEDVPLVLAKPEPSDSPPSSVVKNPIYHVTPFWIDTDRARDFAKRFQDRFKDAPHAEAALSYDAASVLFEGIRRAKSVQGSKVREELLKLKDYDCLTGKLSFDKDQWVRRPLFIVRGEGGAEKLVKRCDPDPEP